MKLLLHACCAPCATYPLETVKEDITLFFYNPAIEPIMEYEKRFTEIEKLAKFTKTKLVIWDYDNLDWHELVKGKETEAEGGERCKICFLQRMRKTAEYAKMNGFDAFATTLSVSPFKDDKSINEAGKIAEKEFGIKFLELDFKKGYMRSVELSRMYYLYRQDYCGCLFSKR